MKISPTRNEAAPIRAPSPLTATAAEFPSTPTAPRIWPAQIRGAVGGHTASSKAIVSAVAELYDRIVNSALLVRRLYLSANHIVPENSLPRHESTEQLDFFSDFASQEKRRAEEATAREREKRRQQAVLAIKKKYGKNAILKGMDLEEGATARDRNGQIGGHKA